MSLRSLQASLRGLADVRGYEESCKPQTHLCSAALCPPSHLKRYKRKAYLFAWHQPLPVLGEWASKTLALRRDVFPSPSSTPLGFKSCLWTVGLFWLFRPRSGSCPVTGHTGGLSFPEFCLSLALISVPLSLLPSLPRAVPPFSRWLLWLNGPPPAAGRSGKPRLNISACAPPACLFLLQLALFSN